MSNVSEVQECVFLLDSGRENVPEVISRLKMVRGNIEDQIVVWYVDQILSILENKKWYAVSSIISCLDRFCPNT